MSIELLYYLCTFASPFVSLNHSPNSFLEPLTSQNPGLSSSPAYGFPGATPASFTTLASLLFSSVPAHLLHWIGLSSGLERTTPMQRSKTEKRVSIVMSVGRLSLGSGCPGRRMVGEPEVVRMECS